ncbi:MAG TPA: threonine--tRNA ligase [Myxococcales bacterium]|nr:threonine--tRNA ligase [Myxococcales bacterium]
MEQVTVTLPDGTQKQADRGTRIADFVASAIGKGLAKAALVAKIDGELVDLSRPLEKDAKLEVVTTKSPEALEVARHDAAHVVASVVQRLFPGTQVTIGPTIEDGFYYDFARDQPFTPEDLEKIEVAANAEIAADHPFVREEVSPAAAVQLFEGKGEKYKVEIIEDIVAKGAKTLTLYRHGDWVDFCLGPHGPSTGRIGVVKLTSVAGAYWRGDSRNPMLQRIYGTAFFDKKALDAHLARLEEAKKRDHRKLGKELELFMTHPWAPGAAFWLPKGTVLYQTLSDCMRRLLLSEGYVEVKTPLIYNKALWERSGHWEHYQENMFTFQSEEQTFSLKPMNCPSHMLIFGSRRRSYRELPMRLHSQDVLHRNEASGTLGGLTRVRQFQQDDGHTYLEESQIGEEAAKLFALLDRVYKAFGLGYTAKLSTRPEKFGGEVALWDRAEAALAAALKAQGLPFTTAPGEGAFYGPKIDFDVHDSLGRKWQCATFQLDFVMPRRFELSYVGEDNAEHVPVVIHRAIYGSFERFIAILIEHYAGAFPAWLAPVQARVVTVADRFLDYGREVAAELAAKGIRVEVDASADKLGAKIREAELAKIPYILVIGEKEQAARAVAPRQHGKGDLGQMPLAKLVELLQHEGKPPFGAP